MQLPSGAALLAVSTAVLLIISAADAFNITKILAEHHEFSDFNHYLTVTHLASEINNRKTITVCAVDNAAMAPLIAKNLPVAVMKNLLSLHVLLDYFGTKKLHQITNGTVLSATMYQSTGNAAGTTGFVNITDLKGGKVGIGAEQNDGNLDASYVKSVKEIPYDVSVIQISKILSSPSAEAPTPAPSQQNLTALMSAHGCKIFADTLAAHPDAAGTFSDSLTAGLTVFCPLDDAFKAFLPKFKNLTKEAQVSLLDYHGVPVYQTMSMLKSSNGLQNTLATDGANSFVLTVQNDGEAVTLQTKIDTARITGTLFDEDPLAIYTIDKVLMPKELFKKKDAPAPAPAPVAEAPKGGKHKKKPAKTKKASPPADDSDEADAPSPSDDDPADQTADKDGAVRFDGAGRLVGAALSLCLGMMLQLM